ncbi:Uncharacterised protein [Delftia tsuruhatensis]|uniref:hypothetical protein n=1 Tax=Delftia tsuruhatensis TaxID=180282 RepID=UPI001E70CA1D|nr:hypothetical protein [Delftia tsuruhatensis]CAB5659084.1 Uncharacterised protein [Delftia tsuruhatensis]CAC9679574.1 Uncharacterised protein [Delftia tsuruhatensis]
MHLVKTPAGQQAFKERHADLSPRLRSAFLLFDGQRSLAQVLEAVGGMGVTQDEILALVEREWLAPREAGGPGLGVVAVAAPSPGDAAVPLPSAPSEPSLAVRYRNAYPLAVAITAGLGLKGFRLNLAVEAAMGYDQLVALAPRLREAASPASYAPLHEALFGTPA